jgi:toxin secretion/phage lysis holin
MKQNILNATVAVLGALVSYLFGGWTPLLSLFFFVIVLDYLSGLGAAIISGQGLSSSIGFKGLIKKFAIVAIVALSFQLDIVLGTSVIMYGSLYFFICNEIISIIENYGRMKLPLPSIAKNIMKILKEKEGG